MSAASNYTIGDLARVAGVTTRTVRYYVAEGLLPPPHGSGRAASYDDGHLQRLELIKLLKEEFLPLNEIRALLDGLDAAAVRDLLAQKHQPPPPPAPETAKAYLRALLDPPSASPPLLRQAAAQKAASQATPAPSPARTAGRSVARHSLVREQASTTTEAGEPPDTTWQRYPLHPDIELHVRQPPTDSGLGPRIGQLITTIRRLIEKGVYK